MSRFVLVHGAWHGAWCWERVAPLLREAGHTVITPTLAGVGERAEELTPEIGLQTHVDDVVAVLREHGPAVLVGHSYAGLVVRAAADAVPGLVERLLLVDGWAGADGTSLFELAPGWFSEGLRGAAAERGDGWRLPVLSPQLLGVSEPEDVAWVGGKLTDHPARTFEERSRLTPAVAGVPAAAIVTSPDQGLPFAEMAEALGYAVTEVTGGHDAMVTAPEELAAALLAVGLADLGDGGLARTMPFAGRLGIEVLRASRFRVEAVMPWSESLCTAGGAAHGGALMALADSCAGLCAWLNLAPRSAGTATLESKTNLLRAVRDGAIRARSAPLRVGRRTIVVETELRDEEGALVAKTTQTQAVL